ncbi:pentatricopeptide repeat-containing protein At1g76280 isoform X2 [Vigna radiata var. radiata]|uniref:Pentatricopeptide repeat-containing protein At1g76280 isoform X2 n=1 Tax=Vigna radiata var. radiata TaxID=3916 RepID=A0A1S3UF18_VIGRR|nr:pentatricopeptide repeat-containing protein At1g76280 isoform X2 [Vigna radiata var. radiata]
MHMNMHRFRARVFLRSISLCKSKWHQHHGAQIHFSQNRTSTEPSMQMQVLKALCSGERKKASDLLLDFGSRTHSLTADDFLHIFKYCARSPDPLFVMEIRRFMELKGVSMNIICSSLMIEALCKGGCLEEAFHVMDSLGGSQCLYPVLPLYNSLLGSCTKMQSLIQANKCLDIMEKKIVGRSEVTYTELLKLAVLAKNLPAAHLLWQEYVKNYSMSIIPLRKFIWSFTRLRDLESAHKTLQQMVSLVGRGNFSIGKTVYGKLYSTRMDIPVPSNKGLGLTLSDLKELKKLDSCTSAELYALNGEERSLHVKVLRWSFNDIIHGCANQKNYILAKKLMLQMENLGLQPSCHTYNGIIKAAVSHGNVGDAIGVLKKMQQKKLKPNDSTLATLSITCSKALQLDLAEAFLNQISECLYPHPYNALLASCDELNQPERAVQVFAKMKQKKVLPNIRTCELLFSLFGVVNAPYEDSDILSQVDAAKRINAIQKDMATNGIKHSHLSIKNILKALGEEGMIRELIQYLHLAENLFIYQNPSSGTHMYNTVLHYLVEAKESDMAIAVFKKMKLCGCNPDSETYNIMIDCCTIIQSYRSACLLISMMIRKGFCPVICTYTAIIKILLEDDNFDEALNLLKQVKLDGIQPDVLLFNTVLKQACYKERIDVIEFIVELMHREKVPPDPRTCGYVFSAYVNSGFHSTAIEALQVLSLRMISEDGNILGEEKKFVNEFILSEDLSAESQILKLFEDSEDELAVGLLNLRWCAIAGFPICESADQSLWARRLEGKRF